MNAAAFRQIYAYHFAANQMLWERHVLPLDQAQFVQKQGYSVGSVRNHVVHMLNIDERWFCGLCGVAMPGFINPVHYAQRAKIRAKWDAVEAMMRAYLAALQDADLTTQPLLATHDDPVLLWQVLLHVVNHGTDHRAQLLALLRGLGVVTTPQDYVVYLDGHL